jgi:hypothetical protein
MTIGMKGHAHGAGGGAGQRGRSGLLRAYVAAYAAGISKYYHL